MRSAVVGSDSVVSIVRIVSLSPRVEESKLEVDPIYPTPPLMQDMTQGQFLSGV